MASPFALWLAATITAQIYDAARKNENDGAKCIYAHYIQIIVDRYLQEDARIATQNNTLRNPISGFYKLKRLCVQVINCNMRWLLMQWFDDNAQSY